MCIQNRTVASVEVAVLDLKNTGKVIAPEYRRNVCPCTKTHVEVLKSSACRNEYDVQKDAPASSRLSHDTVSTTSKSD